ncbi:YciC family protein [Buchnera aphidicola]|uniref:YciC family protein n=1 Tax=Buchnera aphidicola TaxID=9 RepID=UPI003BEF3E2F
MLIKIKEIYHDTHYFFIKQISIITFISIIVTLFGSSIATFTEPHLKIISLLENNQWNNINSIIEIINKFNMHEKKELLRYSILKIIELLASKTLLLSSIITLISFLHYKKKSIILFINSLLKLLPSIFLIHCISMLIIQMGMMFFIFPGIILSFLLLLSPIIFSFQNNNLIDSIYLSIYISLKYIKIIGPMIILWIIAKLLLTMIFSHVIIVNKQFSSFILNISINMLFVFLNIYLFRFYMLFMRSKHS